MSDRYACRLGHKECALTLDGDCTMPTHNLRMGWRTVSDGTGQRKDTTDE